MPLRFFQALGQRAEVSEAVVGDAQQQAEREFLFLAELHPLLVRVDEREVDVECSLLRIHHRSGPSRVNSRTSTDPRRFRGLEAPRRACECTRRGAWRSAPAHRT